MKVEKIVTERFILRKIKKSDVYDIYTMLSNPKIITNLNMDLHTSIKDTEAMIKDYLEEFAKGNKFPFAIVDKESKDLLGVFLIKLDLFDDDCFEFTIYIKEEYWNKGIYKEVLPYMVKFSFEKIKTSNFRGFVMEKNKVSGRVLENSGFIIEKIFDVDGIDGKIKSYLLTKEMYEKEMYEKENNIEKNYYDRIVTKNEKKRNK